DPMRIANLRQTYGADFLVIARTDSPPALQGLRRCYVNPAFEVVDLHERPDAEIATPGQPARAEAALQTPTQRDILWEGELGLISLGLRHNTQPCARMTAWPFRLNPPSAILSRARYASASKGIHHNYRKDN